MKLKFKIKNLLWLLLAAMVVITVITAFWAFNYYQKQTSDSLEKRVGALAITIDSEIVNMLNGSEEDLENLAYLELKDKLIALQQLNSDTRFIYLMGQQGEDIFFYVDSEPVDSEDYSPPGQVYDEASPTISEVFSAKEIKSEISTDRWGKWLSYMAPIIDPATNQVVAVVGVDVAYQNYITSVILFTLLPVAVGLIVIILLIMALVYAKKEEQILQIRSEYFAIAAHDLRAPLTGIKWAMDLLSKLDTQELAKKCKPIFKQIDNSTENMICSVNELLDSSNLDKTNTNTLVPSKVEINILLNSVIENSKVSIEDKQLQVHTALSKPTNLMIDKDKMRRVFSNILSNAIKYSPKGGVIHISSKAIPGSFIISIKDSGIGIPKAEQEKIFSGYYRASNAKEYTTSGTGLGLYYAKNIVELHGGKITLRSEPHQGTDIIISLPTNK